jgi:hypothetical protein
MTTITAKILSVDPARATSMLAKSKGNRSLRQQHIIWLAEQMKTGQWKVAPPGVSFSTTGRLLDGHHRLEAVRLAGVEVPMLVLTGFDDDVWGSIDCGVVRAVHDRISLSEIPVTNRRIIETIQQLLRIENNHKGKLTAQEVTDQWNELRKALTVLFNIAEKHVKGVTRAPVMGAIARYFQRNPTLATDFLRKMLEQDSLHSHHPAHVLRYYLINSQGFPSGGQLAGHIYWTTVAMAHFHFRGFASVDRVQTATAWW